MWDFIQVFPKTIPAEQRPQFSVEGLLHLQLTSESMVQNNESCRPTITSQLSSHGRGGAGNMANASQSPKLNPSDLETPVLKKPVVTTGRGGTGNMAKNDDPQETRLRQDVEA